MTKANIIKFLKEVFTINRPIGRFDFFMVSLIVCLIELLFWIFIYVCKVFNIEQITNLTVLHFVIFIITFGAFLILFFTVIIIWISFVFVAKRLWDILNNKAIAIILSLILTLLSLISEKNIIMVFIVYPILLLVPGVCVKIEKKHKDVIKVSDLLEEGKEEDSSEKVEDGRSEE